MPDRFAIIVAVFAMGIPIAFMLVKYVFQALSLFTIAKRRGLRLYGLAWVPVLDVWVTGSIADDFDRAVKGEERNQRTLLLCLSIGLFILEGVFFFFCTRVIGAASALHEYYEYFGADMSFVSVFPCVMTGLAVSALAIVVCVFLYIALYKVYRSCNPDTCVVFLVLSILFGVTEPFFLFADRKRDDGMPIVKELPQTCVDSEPENRDYNGNL